MDNLIKNGGGNKPLTADVTSVKNNGDGGGVVAHVGDIITNVTGVIGGWEYNLYFKTNYSELWVGVGATSAYSTSNVTFNGSYERLASKTSSYGVSAVLHLYNLQPNTQYRILVTTGTHNTNAQLFMCVYDYKK